ncbi:hypothetical protein B0H19DRAFT_1071691 [Mycena capillaripes]|nr:hypothetical protein B0H19DRAFT_1071691 [Mycena capillaripes]
MLWQQIHTSHPLSLHFRLYSALSIGFVAVTNSHWYRMTHYKQQLRLLPCTGSHNAAGKGSHLEVMFYEGHSSTDSGLCGGGFRDLAERVGVEMVVEEKKKKWSRKRDVTVDITLHSSPI